MPSDARQKSDWIPSGQQAGDGMVAGAGKVMSESGKTMLQGTPRAARIVLRQIPGAPGLVLDGVSLMTAKDKGRATAEILGGVAGGAAGAWAGPIGVAVGSTLGQKAGEMAYDHKDDIGAWMKAREQEIARGLMNRVQPYMLPPQYRQRY